MSRQVLRCGRRHDLPRRCATSAQWERCVNSAAQSLAATTTPSSSALPDLQPVSNPRARSKGALGMGIAQPNALQDLYSQMAVRMAAEPPMDLPGLRDMLEGLQVLAAEPTDVNYANVDAGGVHAILVTPADARTDRVIVYAHGGGGVTGSSASHRKLAGHLAKAAGTQALVPDYRVAPETPFPAAIQDLVAVHRWLRSEGYAPEATAVAGDSAGGNLSISTVLKLRELGEPLPAAIIGFSPRVVIGGAREAVTVNA